MTKGEAVDEEQRRECAFRARPSPELVDYKGSHIEVNQAHNFPSRLHVKFDLTPSVRSMWNFSLASLRSLPTMRMTVFKASSRWRAGISRGVQARNGVFALDHIRKGLTFKPPPGRDVRPGYVQPCATKRSHACCSMRSSRSRVMSIHLNAHFAAHEFGEGVLRWSFKEVISDQFCSFWSQLVVQWN